LILPANQFVDDWRLDQKRETLYYLKWTGEIWKMDLATKKTEHVASIREMRVDFDVSEDHKMVMFTPRVLDWRSSMIVMENLFE
jgi:Tol biopolymer transport system component